jgi:hypothetical protein
MSNLYDNSPIKFPCSAYSLPLSLAKEVGFWDTDSQSIGEDMHMYLKCFFATNGQLKIQTIYSPASQCNVEGSTHSWWDGIKSRYTQAKRHMWGCLDTSYSIRKTIFGLLAPGYDVDAQGQLFKVNQMLVKQPVGQVLSLPLQRLFSLFHRLSEAHFLMVIISVFFI